MKKARAGIVGCGAISGIYFEAGRKFEMLDIVACADLVPERAKTRATEFGARACSVDELLGDPDIDIVINLTVPKAHYDIARRAIRAGKSVHSEKPLSITRDEGRDLLKSAKTKKVLVGCAPDTFLGGGHQTCRKLIDDGWIGEPVGATAFMMCHGHESWHPSPEFYYEIGGGPMFDMGPYYLTALVNMIGPVKRVAGMNRITFPERRITSQPKFGKIVKVETPTHVTGLLEFANGAIGTIITTFDVWAAQLPRIEVYGTEGTLSVPDPNGFGGPVRIRRPGAADWTDVPLCFGYADNSRGIGVADMACALGSGRKHRASGELAYHVLDIMHAFHDASNQQKHVELKSACERPAPLPMGLRDGALDK